MAVPRPSQSTTTSKSPARLLACLCLALIVIIGLVILITWLAIRPKKVQYSIDEGWITGYNLTDNQLTSNFNFVLRTYNPSKKASVYYDKMEVTVLYRGQTVAFETIQPFVQPKRNVTRLTLQNSAHSVALPPHVVHDLKVERTGSEVDLDIKIRARIKYKVGIFKSRHYTLKALCSPVVVSFSDAKRFSTKDCDVDI